MNERYKIVCDETNNTPETIAQNKLIIDYYVRIDVEELRRLHDGDSVFITKKENHDQT